MHSSSLKTIDPRILPMPGRGRSGFHRPGRHGVHQAQRAVKEGGGLLLNMGPRRVSLDYPEPTPFFVACVFTSNYRRRESVQVEQGHTFPPLNP